MSARDADLTLRQIVEVCDKAVELRNSMTWEEFRGDWRKQMLGERLVEVLGEAVKRLPNELRDRHPQLPWDKIAGTRDYIAHGYDSVDYDVIWGVLDVEAARLKASVLAILGKGISRAAGWASQLVQPLGLPARREAVECKMRLLPGLPEAMQTFASGEAKVSHPFGASSRKRASRSHVSGVALKPVRVVSAFV